MEPAFIDVTALRHAWTTAEHGKLWFLQDFGHAVVEYPPPRKPGDEDLDDDHELPTATFRLFAASEDAYMYRMSIVEQLTAGDTSVTETLERYKLHAAPLHSIWNDLFEVQMNMNENHVRAVLEVVLSKFHGNHDRPIYVDTLYHETTDYN